MRDWEDLLDLRGLTTEHPQETPVQPPRLAFPKLSPGPSPEQQGLFFGLEDGLTPLSPSYPQRPGVPGKCPHPCSIWSLLLSSLPRRSREALPHPFSQSHPGQGPFLLQQLYSDRPEGTALPHSRLCGLDHRFRLVRGGDLGGRGRRPIFKDLELALRRWRPWAVPGIAQDPATLA